MKRDKIKEIREKLDHGDRRLESVVNSSDLVSDGMLTVHECASFLHLSRSRVYELMDNGFLCYAKFGRSRRIPRRAVIEFAASELRGGFRGSS